MSVVEQIYQSSSRRTIALRKRPDLTIVRQVYRNEPFWLIKDPLEMEFYRLNEEEHAILDMLDGHNSLDDIKIEFERKFSPQRITHRELQSFVADLRKKSLLAFTQGDVAPHLMERRIEKQNEKLKSKAMSLFALKWRGVDPEGLLNFLHARISWLLFSLPAVIMSCIVMLAAVTWLLVHLDEFWARLPSLSMFLSGNFVLLTSVIICMKIVHELAHGLVFKRFGGECHEIGVMLLVLIMPTLYCNTSDSWLLKNKWHRAAIGAAGMYIELLIAALATFGWWFSNPGTFNMICLNIMATGTVSVLLMNGNPFFKFDGYYIFSDIFELPNLQERAGTQTFNWFLEYCLGIEEQSEINSTLSTKWWLVGYCILSFAFKLGVTVMILTMLLDRMSPYGLASVAFIAGIAGNVLMFAPAALRFYKFFRVPGSFQRIEMKNSILTIGIWIGLLCLVFVVPFPHHVKCPFTIEPRDGQSVYVEHEASLDEVFVEPGQTVKDGELIARLQNLEKARELIDLNTQCETDQAELDLLQRTRESSPDTAARIANLRQSVATAEAKIKELKVIVDSYEVYARRDGVVIPEWSSSSATPKDELESFSGTAFDAENIGAWFESGEKLCTVGDLTMFDAVLKINEYDVSLTEAGQTVELMLDSRSGQRVRQTIDSIARKESDEIPESLSDQFGGSIPVEAPEGASKEAKPEPTDEHFEARVTLPQLEYGYSSGLRGQARIRVGSATLFSRLKRLGYRTFNKRIN